MLRTFFIIFLSIATLLLAYCWFWTVHFDYTFLRGFGCRRPPLGEVLSGAFTTLWVPTLLLAVSWALFPVVNGGLRRRRRRRRGLCVMCGYDLTGNESGTCSECGASL